MASRVSKVLIVHTHPVVTRYPSFTRAMAGSMATGLRKAGVDVRRVDLDEARFSPLLTEEERLTYFNENEQPQLTGDPVVKELVDGLRWCEGLALAYPTWWFNLPARMKGFFDRCFVPGVGFKYDKELGRRTTGLQNISRLGVATTYGFDEPTVSKAGDAGRLMLEGGMTMLMHPQVVTQWDPLYSMQAEGGDEARAKFLVDLEAAYAKW